ncbi:MAG: amylo-alpha-1,6-glucosidase [Desulfotomaculaceae bacterium]|nr:amylo-alpha-1,6-glucosidase [Desulfotomaculaceae bacterium]MDD4766367.1 amylo-alpha-1,6-glucosidase [Desulfotomaculaceae bacterium]
MYFFGKSDWCTFEQGAQKEWLVTNGIGGYASGTIINANTRKYHGLLIAAHDPPGWRVVHLSKLDERFSSGPCTYNLAANQHASGFAELGFIHLQQVRIDPFPTFTYSFGDIFLEKTVFMVHGSNTTVILYRVLNGTSPGVLRLTPMVNCRGHHFITCQGQIDFTQTVTGGSVAIKGRDEMPSLKLSCDAGIYVQDGKWYNSMAYAAEEERGENPYEDLYIPGYFEISFSAGENKSFSVIATTADSGSGGGAELLKSERERISRIVDLAGSKDRLIRCLACAADAFIVQRPSTGKKTIIAGYPWFADWGRDTMIALPGLTLVTRRFQEAKEILQNFVRHCRKGLMPNAFFDGAGPVFNTVDASLWFVNAVYKYLVYTADLDFIRECLYPAVKDIIYWYMTGTEYNIAMDEDGLLNAGSPHIQLTWMDAKVNDWVVTPRHGKAVEINALWYNSLMVFNTISKLLEKESAFTDLPEKIKKSYQHKFWNESGGYLNDVVSLDGTDNSVRPNQLLAVSLPYSILTPEQMRRVVEKVWSELYVTYGIRSLSPWDPAYQGIYKGDRIKRDGAYHQGTAWSWLIGPFITAYRRANHYNASSLEQARRFISPFRDQLRDHGVGYISEIFDGDEPAVPRGAIAQAWGVAEVLRAYIEDVLEIPPPALKIIKELEGGCTVGATM